MNEFDYLDSSYPDKNTTFHSKLLRDFTGKDLPTLIKEGTFYIGWGFSYQERSQTVKNNPTHLKWSDI